MTRPNGRIQTRERSAVMSQGSRAMSRPPIHPSAGDSVDEKIKRLEKALDRKSCHMGLLEKELDRLRKHCMDLERAGPSGAVLPKTRRLS